MKLTRYPMFYETKPTKTGSKFVATSFFIYNKIILTYMSHFYTCGVYY